MFRRVVSVSFFRVGQYIGALREKLAEEKAVLANRDIRLQRLTKSSSEEVHRRQALLFRLRKAESRAESLRENIDADEALMSYSHRPGACFLLFLAGISVRDS